MAGYDAVVIGSGAGGLVCAAILAKEGRRVLVTEKHNRLGGYLQRFYREKIPFDTGFHYTGKLAPGACLRRYLEYLGVWDQLRFHELDREGFDVVRGPGLEVRVPAGRERWRERLRERFPAERPAVDAYCDEVARLCDKFPLYTLDGRDVEGAVSDVIARQVSLEAFFESVRASPELRFVLCGQLFLHATPPARVPFWVHALVTDSFISDGAWGLDGGGDALARALSRKIREHGGEIRLHDGAARVVVEDRVVKGVVLESGERIEAPTVVSGIHPRRLLELLPEGAVTPAYAGRIQAFEESVSSIGLYLRMNRRFRDVGPWNVYWYRTRRPEDIWSERTGSPGGPRFFFLTWPAVRDASWRYPDNMIVLAGVAPDEVGPWDATRTGARSEDYERWKARAGDWAMGTLERDLEGFKGSCDLLAVSSPLTNRDYTGSHLGSNYGILQSLEQQGIYKLSVRTRVKGLYLTGQNLGLMGLVGVTVTAFRTAGEILGMGGLIAKVRGL